KTADNAAFLGIVSQLDGQSSPLTTLQSGWLRYLKAWQLSYTGQLDAALPALRAVMDESSDVTLRYRANATLINSLALASQYEEAYARLSQLIEMQSAVPRKEDRVIGYAVAALLYDEAGQYDFAIVQAEHWMSEDPGDRAICKAGQQKVDSLYRAG